jgi:hypothetical protein
VPFTRWSDSAFICRTDYCWNRPPIPGPARCAALDMRAARHPQERASPHLQLCRRTCPSDLIGYISDGAEDRATQGCDLSADSVAGMAVGALQRSPHLSRNPGTKAINPRGLGTESPLAGGVTIADQLVGHSR